MTTISDIPRPAGLLTTQDRRDRLKDHSACTVVAEGVEDLTAGKNMKANIISTVRARGNGLESWQGRRKAYLSKRCC